MQFQRNIYILLNIWCRIICNMFLESHPMSPYILFYSVSQYTDSLADVWPKIWRYYGFCQIFKNGVYFKYRYLTDHLGHKDPRTTIQRAITSPTIDFSMLCYDLLIVLELFKKIYISGRPSWIKMLNMGRKKKHPPRSYFVGQHGL